MNPELTRWTGPQGLPRFDLIGDSDFAPAFDRELAAAKNLSAAHGLPALARALFNTHEFITIP